MSRMFRLNEGRVVLGLLLAGAVACSGGAQPGGGLGGAGAQGGRGGSIAGSAGRAGSGGTGAAAGGATGAGAAGGTPAPGGGNAGGIKGGAAGTAGGGATAVGGAGGRGGSTAAAGGGGVGGGWSMATGGNGGRGGNGASNGGGAGVNAGNGGAAGSGGAPGGTAGTAPGTGNGGTAGSAVAGGNGGAAGGAPSSAGTLRWARHEVGGGQDRALSVAVTPSGAIVFGGVAVGNATFWTGQPDQRAVSLPSSSADAMFLARVTGSGALTWLRTAGNSAGAKVDAIAAVGEDVLVAGEHGNAADDVILGAGEPSETHLKLYGMFLARYRADGTLVWARSTGGSAFVTTTQLAAMPDGGAVAVGQFDFAPVFGPGEPKETTLVHNGGNNSGFIARFGPDGSLMWALPIHDAETIETYNYNVAVRPDGTILFGVSYTTSVMLPGTAGTGVTVNPAPAGNGGFALVSYDGDGKLQWARTTGGPAWVLSRGMVLLSDGSAAVSGQISPPAGVASNPSYGDAVFGSGESQETTLNARYQSGFVAKYAADGRLLWARLVTGALHDYESLAELPDHRIVVAGTFGNYVGLPTSITFGAGEPGQRVLSWFPGTTTANGMYTYLAWYNPDGSISDARTIGTAQSDQVRGMAVAPDASVVLCGAFSTQMTFGPTDPAPVSYTHGSGTGLTQDAYLAKFSY